MGKRSVKENKNMFQLAREDAGLSREAASEEMEFVSESRIDGRIADDELRDFARIKSQLDDIAQTVDALQLWLEKTIAADGIDAEALQEYLKDE